MLLYAIKQGNLPFLTVFSPYIVFSAILIVKAGLQSVINLILYVRRNKLYICLSQNIDLIDIVEQIPKFPVRRAYNLEFIVFERTTIAFFNSLLGFWPHRNSTKKTINKDFFREQLADFNDNEFAQFAVYLQMRGVQRYIIGLNELYETISTVSNKKHEELQGNALNASERCI